MNVTYNFASKPLRVLIVNPMLQSGILFAHKILRGVSFGTYQMIDLILLVYSNEVEKAKKLKVELELCGLACTNSITITSDLPKITDADVFVCITEFPNLNWLDFTSLSDPETFDTLYLLLKIATNLEMPPPPEPVPPEQEKMIPIKKRVKLLQDPPRKPIIICGSLIGLYIVKHFSKNLPNDIFFCPTPIEAVTKLVLADYLKIRTHELNQVYVWAANDDIFYVEVRAPIVKDRIETRYPCKWKGMANVEMKELSLDITQFNPSWMKKELIEKIGNLTRNHPNGPIYKSVQLSQLLNAIWKTRRKENPEPVSYGNYGIISDGSLGTIKGFPYFMPLVFKGDSYTIDDYNKDDVRLKQEIKRINTYVHEHYKKLISICKKFLEKNVIQQEFVPRSSSSLLLAPEDSLYSSTSSSMTSVIK